MDVNGRIAQVERIIDYEFAVKSYAQDALTAAHRKENGESNDGHRKLAAVGGDLIELTIKACWAGTNITRAQLDHYKVSFATKANLFALGVKSKIDDCIQRSPQQSTWTPKKVVARAVKAIVAAVWYDSYKNFEAVDRVVFRLVDLDNRITMSFPGQGSNDTTEDARLHMNLDGDSLETASASNERSFKLNSVVVHEDNIFDNGQETIDFNQTFNKSLQLDSRLPAPFYQSCIESILDVSNSAEHFKETRITPPCVIADYSITNWHTTPFENHSIDLPTSPSLKRKRHELESKDSKVATTANLKQYIRIEEEKWKTSSYPTVQLKIILEAIDESILKYKLGHRHIEAKLICLLITSCHAVISLKDIVSSYRGVSNSIPHNTLAAETSTDLYHAIQSLHGESPDIVFRRRYNVLRLYSKCLDSCSCQATSGFIINTSSTTTFDRKRLPGNPINRAVAEQSRVMIEQVFPDIDEKEPQEKELCKKEIERIRNLGKNLSNLADKLGIGVIALLSCNLDMTPFGINFAISDQRIRKLSRDDLGNYIALLQNAPQPIPAFIQGANKIMKTMLDTRLRSSEEFQLESTSVESIRAQPGSSQDLLSLLHPRSM